MKTVWVIALLLGTASGLYARPLPRVAAKEVRPAIAVTCEAEKIELETLSKTDYADIHLRCTLENGSWVPIIFLQATPIALSAEIVTLGSSVRTVASGFFATSSFLLQEDEWKTLVGELNRQKPPPGKTYSLAPGGTQSFNSVIRFDLPHQPFFIGLPPEASVENKSLAFLKDVSPLSLKVRFETWSILPLMIRNKIQVSRQRDFGRKLRSQWKPDGYLWLDETQAEPMTIDLNTAVGK
jgi:hypothetical protein